MENTIEKIEEIKDKMKEIKKDFPHLTEGQLRLEAIRKIAKNERK
jgi:uncharacterized protein (DUF433 family)